MINEPALLVRQLLARPPVVLVVLPFTDTLDALRAVLTELHGARVTELEHLADVQSHPDELVMYAPALEREADAVVELERHRDTLDTRGQPLVLVLRRDGPGMNALAQSPGIWSWLLPHTVDETTELQGSPLDGHEGRGWKRAQDRERFAERHGGLTPDEWLAEWRRGALPNAPSTDFSYHEALALSHRGGP